jgi:hypothetical protein
MVLLANGKKRNGVGGSTVPISIKIENPGGKEQ